ncbi:P-loop containing nucleoside triphosphate hydrolase protein [Phlebopus sp. FC_14]|nr:P-loop containing nucleoside triphosphate hydrolase protein [Phlebopus sp. FC_14]
MAKSATLNPTSTPFFPGSIRIGKDEGSSGFGFGVPTLGGQDRAPASYSASPLEHRSIRSSPSPRQDNGSLERQPDMRFQSSPMNPDVSSAAHQPEHDRQYVHRMREANIVGGLEALPEGDDTHGSATTDEGAQTPGDPPQFFATIVPHSRGNTNTPPVNIISSSLRSSSFHNNGSFISSSPVSSLDSGSQLASSADLLQSLDAQLKVSPLIQDIIDRLLRCEYATQEVQKELRDVHRKVDFLVERSLASATQANGSQPEFKDPFAPTASSAMTIPRPSLSANVAPNQSPPSSDDITQISQRLSTLTTSVGQLLALQTQQHIQNATSLGRVAPHTPDLPQNQTFGNSLGANPALLGHGLPNRPDLRSPRAPNPPLRTWSAGTLDLPLRVDSVAPMGRPEPARDKRRSVTGGLMRRESSSVIDGGNDWQGSSSRDTGPMISKWEQLNLAPDLLRSLSKFGVGPPNKIQQRALPFLLRGSDIIAQAPPTQERIAAYVIPAIQVAVVNTVGRSLNRGPLAVMISTTVDQATQAQRMIRDLGGPIGIRSALGVGASTNANDLTQELRLLQQNMPHILCGTPQKLHALFTSPGGLTGSEVRFLVLDEVDQLIARNLHDFVFNIVKLLPAPRSRPLSTGTPAPGSNSVPQASFTPFDATNSGRRFSAIPASPPSDSGVIERQTALFSNTVPQDVLNLATAIQLREPVRVLVRRDGNVTSSDANQGSRGLRQFYLYLAFTAGSRGDTANPAVPGGGHGIIGSGRGASSAETAQAREWKLEALADIFDDVEVSQAIVHVAGMNSLDAVVYKLASRGLEAVPLHSDMNAGTKLAALNKFKSSPSVIMRQPVTKVLVVNDVQVKIPDVSHVPLIINYDLPKAVEEYAHRVAPAIASNYVRAGVIVNFVTATGGDVEMLRSIECFYK